MDIVFLCGLCVETSIGIYDWEKKVKQPVVLDLEMAADIGQAAASDRIEDALDYEAVCERVKQFVGDSRFDLIETLAERCTEILREEFGIPWIRLRLNKVGALGDAIDVGVVIERGERK